MCANSKLSAILDQRRDPQLLKWCSIRQPVQSLAEHTQTLPHCSLANHTLAHQSLEIMFANLVPIFFVYTCDSVYIHKTNHRPQILQRPEKYCKWIHDQVGFPRLHWGPWHMASSCCIWKEQLVFGSRLSDAVAIWAYLLVLPKRRWQSKWRVHKLRPESQRNPHLLLQIRFYWNTATSFLYILSVTAFCPLWLS